MQSNLVDDVKRQYLRSLSHDELVALVMTLDQKRDAPIFPLALTSDSPGISNPETANLSRPPLPPLPPTRQELPPVFNVSDNAMPTYEEMICMGLADLAQPDGSNPRSIFDWMSSRFPLLPNFRPSAHQALQKALKRGRLIKVGSKYKFDPTWTGGSTSKRTTRRPQVANGGQAPTLPLPGFAFPPPQQQDPLLEAIAGINEMVEGDEPGGDGEAGEEELKAGLIRLATQLKMFAASNAPAGDAIAE